MAVKMTNLSSREDVMQAFTFCINILIYSAPFRLIIRRWNVIPQGVFTIIHGISIALIYTVIGTRLEVGMMMGGVTSYYMMKSFVPIYIVSTMYNTNYPNFMKYLPPVLLITVFGGIISPLLLGFILSQTFLKIYGMYNCGVLMALSVVPIEPLYVIAIIKRLARYKHLETLLEAEAVILMIPIFILFDIFSGLQIGVITEWYHIVNVILRKIILGLVIGYVTGKIHVLFMVYMDMDGYYTAGISICITFITYYFTEQIAFGSGQLALLCNMCQVLRMRHKLSPKADANIVMMWDTIHYVTETMWFTFATIQYSLHMYYHIQLRMIFAAVLMYLTTQILRLLGLIILSPVLYKITKQINLKVILVLTWSGIRGPIALHFGRMIVACNDFLNMDVYLCSVYVTVILSFVINAFCVEPILRIIGFSQFSSAQRTNMNVYVDMLNKKTEYIISNLKFSRYFDGVYWYMARDFVKLDYSSEADNRYKSHRLERNPCDQCVMDVPYNVTELELAELLQTNEIKIIKLKKIFVINQYLSGTIDKQCLELITKKLEQKLDYSKHKQTNIDLSGYFKPGVVLVFCHKLLKILSATPNITPPPSKKPLRQLAFYLTMHFAYDYIIYGVTLVNSIFILWNNRNCCVWMYKYHAGLWCFYILDFLLKTYGLSLKTPIISACKPYFDRKCNWIDFFCLLATLINFFVWTDDAVYGWILYYIIPSLRLIAAIRLLSVACFLRTLCPLLLSYIDYRINLRFCFVYELGSALIQCDKDVIAVLQETVELKTIRNVFRKEMIENISEQEKQLQKIEKEKPYIALTVKTKQTIQITLNVLRAKLQELEKFCVFDLQECNYIQALLASHNKKLRRIKLVPEYLKHEILKNVPWITTESQYEYSINNIKMIAWNVGDLVQSKGEVSEGIYVILTGLLRSYVMRTEKEQSTDGLLPIIDNLASIDSRKVEEILLSGDILGELSYITGRPYECNVVAESFCQAYWFTPELLRKAYEDDNNPVNGLECKIWKNCCINIAVAILMKVPVYKTNTRAEIKQKLSDCFMPNLRCYKTFILTEKIRDVILIEGTVESSLTGEIFVAPVLIPRAVQRIKLAAERTNAVQLMIVPIEGVTEIEIMTEEEELAEFIPEVSSKYLLTQKKQKNIRRSIVVKDIPVRNVNSISMESYIWHVDKEIIRLDNDEEISREYYDNTKMNYLPKNRPLTSGSSSSSIEILKESRQFKDLAEDDYNTF